MTIPSYLFQSPYPQQVQFGTPDPVAQAQQIAEEQTSTVEAVNNDAAPSLQSGSTPLGGSGINVAAGYADAGVASALETFTNANTQVQAAAAYSA